MAKSTNNNTDPLYIGNEMAAFDRKDRAYYDKFTDEERKKFSTYLMCKCECRYASILLNSHK
jgi:hypothetical protein